MARCLRSVRKDSQVLWNGSGEAVCVGAGKAPHVRAQA